MEKILGRAEPNVGSLERLASAALGAYLIYRGIRRGLITGAPTAMAGIGLVTRAVSGYCPVYGTLGVDRSDGGRARAELPLRVEQSVVVMRPATELYATWRDLAGLPRFMRHLESVTVIDELRSRWVTRGPVGTTLGWDAVIVHDELGVGLGWRSLPDESGEATVEHAGSVRFRGLPDGRGTEVTVMLRYRPTGGVLGATVARLLGEHPDRQIAEDLARFRDLAERPMLEPAASPSRDLPA
jgi:uncharacterized membrane protein